MNESQPDSTDLLSVEEAATKLKVSKKTLLKWAREGKIGSIRFSAKVIRFSEEQLTEFVTRMTHEIRPDKTRRSSVISPPLSPGLPLRRGKRQQSWKELRAEMDSWGKDDK